MNNFELILINDGSTDNSLNICEKYSRQNKNITLINQENSGVSIARNKGLSIAKGEYIFCMDSDDTIPSNFLESSYDLAKIKNADIVVSGLEFLKYGKDKIPAFPIWAMLFKKSLLAEYSDIIFPENIQPCEDGLFSHKLLAITDNIAFNKKAVYQYRKHAEQNHIIINKTCEKVLNQIPKWFEILEEFYTGNELWDKKKMHLLRFIEHEPFEYRFKDMPLNKDQQIRLFSIIKTFINNHFTLTKEEISTFSKEFRFFLECENFKEFILKVQTEKKRDKGKYKLFKSLINLIPSKGQRLRMKHNLKKVCLK